MTVPPESGFDRYEDERRWAGKLPTDPGDVAEEEIEEHEMENQEVEYLDSERHEAHAPGQVCARCGTVISAGQDARRRLDGTWVHEVCPAG
ncbi:MAG TPA: hypothetical protein VMH35_19555 [Streptosporangiaceae bacterium]|nr:hypothetical protein [Streptosporangiaceae bacterium]